MSPGGQQNSDRFCVAVAFVGSFWNKYLCGVCGQRLVSVPACSHVLTFCVHVYHELWNVACPAFRSEPEIHVWR